MISNWFSLQRATADMPTKRKTTLNLVWSKKMADLRWSRVSTTHAEKRTGRCKVLKVFLHLCLDNDTSHCRRATKGFFSNQGCSRILESGGRSVG